MTKASAISKIVEPSPAAMRQAVAVLQAGGLVGLPTETVYGLAGDAANGLAIARIFEVKGRPAFNPLISHVPDIVAAAALADFPPLAVKLAERYWPGPLTLVLPKRRHAPVHPLVTAGLDTIAIRAPAHHVARQLLAAFGKPVAAPSANPSGRLSPTTALHVAKGLGDGVDLILDGGPCVIGLESTVVEVTADAVFLLRPGAVTQEALAQTLGQPVRAAGKGVKSPGQLAQHYAPHAPLRRAATRARAGEKLLGFGAIEGDINLSPSADLREAAANLFASLHALDAMHPSAIAVAPIPQEGLGRAINDRLARAAAKR
ncbi:MAG: L-threonylcarbamoyladenylate synthase [Pseudomonadota bacterium]|jgi:L-threonylcarbamoyladenylate synthase